MSKIFLLLVTLVLITISAGCGNSDSQTAPKKLDAIKDAFILCQMMKETGLTTQCSVNGGGSAVDVTIDINSAEARKTCVGVADNMAKITTSFAGHNWQLQIFSPYSGERPIATCPLH